MLPTGPFHSNRVDDLHSEMQFSTVRLSDMPREQWDGLYGQSKRASVFYAWEFLESAARTMGRLQDLRIVTGDLGGSPVLAQPVFVTREDGKTVVRFFKALSADGVAPVGLENATPGMLRLLVRYLVSSFAADNIIVEAASEDFYARLKASLAANAVNVERTKKGTQIPLPESMEAYWSSLKSSRRNEMKRKVRKGGEAGLSFRVISSRECTDPAELCAAFTRLTELHKKRFDSLGRESFFVQDNVQALHQKAIELNQDALVFDFVECVVDSKVVGSVYSVAGKDEYVCMMTGFDPDFESLSVGALTILSSVERAISLGLRHLDLKVGAEPYKNRWSKEKYLVYDLRLSPERGLIRNLLSRVGKMRRRAKSMPMMGKVAL
jgi:CelD/BcsL family acetyltransferase involved in cellulose biosynthesis